MAGGAKQRKKRSAREGAGTGRRSTTSYHPQTALPPAAMAEESEKRSQAGLNRLPPERAYTKHETAAIRAATQRPKSPMNKATPGDPQPRAAPTAYPAQTAPRASWERSPTVRPVAALPGEQGPEGAHRRAPRAVPGALAAAGPACPPRRVGSSLHWPNIARRPLALRFLPDAVPSTAQPSWGRYTRAVTQGHSFSTLRYHLGCCRYAVRPGSSGA